MVTWWLRSPWPGCGAPSDMRVPRSSSIGAASSASISASATLSGARVAAVQVSSNTVNGSAAKVASGNDVLKPKLPPPPPRPPREGWRRAPPAAAPRPVEAAVDAPRLRPEAADLPVRRDDLARGQLIARKPVRAHVEADAAAEQVAGRADRRAAAMRDGEGVALEDRVEILVAHAAGDRDAAVAQARRAHQQQVDHQAALADREARIGMAGALHDQREAVFAAPRDRERHVLGRAAERDPVRQVGRIAQMVGARALGEVEAARAAPRPGDLARQAPP